MFFFFQLFLKTQTAFARLTAGLVCLTLSFADKLSNRLLANSQASSVNTNYGHCEYLTALAPVCGDVSTSRSHDMS